MVKNTLDMSYDELSTLLDDLLKKVGLPSKITYKSDKINYTRRNKIPILIKAVYRVVRAQIFYMTYIQKRIAKLKNLKEEYEAFEKTKSLKNLRTYFYLSKAGLTDLAKQIGGRFDDKIFSNFNIGTMLYDGSFDIPVCKKYLKDFEKIIMDEKRIEAGNEYMSLFQDCCDYIEKKIGKDAFERFRDLIQIEHVCQLMSIYQLSDKPISKEDLMKITYAKGGISGLAVMFIMAPNMSIKAQKSIYELGAVLQIIDDISDIDEDLETGIKTLVNQKLLTFEELKELYFGTVNNLIDQLEIDPKKPNSTLDMLCWFTELILEKRYSKFSNFSD
jgi:hypothetical protein